MRHDQRRFCAAQQAGLRDAAAAAHPLDRGGCAVDDLLLVALGLGGERREREGQDSRANWG